MTYDDKGDDDYEATGSNQSPEDDRLMSRFLLALLWRALQRLLDVLSEVGASENMFFSSSLVSNSSSISSNSTSDLWISLVLNLKQMCNRFTFVVKLQLQIANDGLDNDKLLRIYWELVHRDSKF